MAKQTLAALQSAFGMKPVAIEITGFEDMPSQISAFLKDGGTVAQLVKEFGEVLGKIYETLAKDGSFYLKPLLSAARDEYEASMAGLKGKHNFANLRAKLVALSWCSADGVPVGTPKQLADMRTDLVSALYKQIRHINGMDLDDAKLTEAGND